MSSQGSRRRLLEQVRLGDETDRSAGSRSGHTAVGGWYLAPRLAKALVTTVLSGLVVVALLTIFASTGSNREKALGAFYLAAMLLLQLRFLRRRPPPVTTPVGFLALLAQVVLAYLPFFQLGQAWVAMPGFLAGGFLLALPRVAAWTSFTAVVASVLLIQQHLAPGWYNVSYSGISTVITGLLVYGLTRLAALVADLGDARAEIARLAVVQERLRMSRDLHDLLGYSSRALSDVTTVTENRIVTSVPPDVTREAQHN